MSGPAATAGNPGQPAIVVHTVSAPGPPSTTTVDQPAPGEARPGDEPDAHEAHVVLEREIALLLRRARAIQVRLASELHRGLDGAAYGLLVLLDDAGPLRASDVVTRLGLDKSTVSRQVASLVETGLVDRAADPDDGRAQVLSTSVEGHRRLSEIRDTRRSRWEADLADWPTRDVATLGELLGRLNRLGEAREAQVAQAQSTPA